MLYLELSSLVQFVKKQKTAKWPITKTDLKNLRIFIFILPFYECFSDRVGHGAYAPIPPSEPYVTIFRHTAQAFQRLS